MRNNGLFSTLFIDDVRGEVELDDQARGRMATLAQTWSTSKRQDAEALWGTFMKQALGYLQFVPANTPSSPGLYSLYEDWGFNNRIALLFLVEPGANIDGTAVGHFWPAKLIVELKRRKLKWGILTDGSAWRLYSTKSSRPFEDYVELSLAEALADNDEAEYGLFERFFHKDSFIPKEPDGDREQAEQDEAAGVYKCRLDADQEDSEGVLDKWVKQPLLDQVDEILRYLCNGFIADTPRRGEEYTEEERKEIFESAVKLLYRCLFLFYAEARRLLPSDADKAEIYKKHSIQALCAEARKFRWGERTDTDGYDLWKQFKGLINAVNDGDPEYGIMGYDGGLFDDEKEVFLGRHKLRNDFFARPLYLLAYVEPYNSDPDDEYTIPYEDLEVRHLGELYENILEYTVTLARADRIRRRTKKGVQFPLASETTKQENDSLISKGDVYFGESALERKQTGSYYTPESLVRFLNSKAIIEPLREKFEADYRPRFDQFLAQAREKDQAASAASAVRSAAALVQRYVDEAVLPFKVCDPAMGSGHFLVDAANQMAGLVVELLAEIPPVAKLGTEITSAPNDWRRRIARHCLYGVDLNPLAVNLAKLSLWLNCFATQHRLTFLDHHLRCGNSLIGLCNLDQLRTVPKRKKGGKRKSESRLPEFEELPDVLGDAAEKTRSITAIDEDDTDQQKEVFEKAHETTDAMISPLADLFTAYLMDYDIDADDYRFLFRHFAEGNSSEDLPAGRLTDIRASIEAYNKSHNFFHWPVAFPEVFGSEDHGDFDATVGNPPWDMVSANPQEFFGRYDAGFRKLGRTASLKRIKSLCDDYPRIHELWILYQKTCDEQNAYLNQPTAYAHAPTGRNNVFHYFLLRAYAITRHGGQIAQLVPGSFIADGGVRTIRSLFFKKTSLRYLYCFSNEKFIFKNVHHAFRIVAIVAKRGDSTTAFRTVFATDPREAIRPTDLDNAFQRLESSALVMTRKVVERFSPKKMSPLEFKTQLDIDLTERLCSRITPLGQSDSAPWHIRCAIELMSNNDAWRFTDRTGEGVPVFAGRHFFQFTDTYSDPDREITEDHFKQIYPSGQQPWKDFRIVFRDVTGGTSERTCIATILPPPTVCLETARLIYIEGVPSAHEHALSSLFLIGVLNSFCVDFVSRFMVRLHLSQHILESLPVLRLPCDDDRLVWLAGRVARLVCTSGLFKRLWESAYDPSWSSQVASYPNEQAESITYGPVQEQRKREAIANHSGLVAKKWSIASGVHDRQQDGRDVGDRSQLRAEIDAMVAHMYGLSRDEFAYILNTFPVLRIKEERFHGEFMSRRKCLEEYDRLALILGDEK